MRVMIVDDSPTVLELLGGILGSAGYEVVKARDGSEALSLIRTGAARLVVSDLEMPGMNGLDLCRAVRAADIPGYVYFMLLSAHSDVRERVEGLGAGADDYVAKPFEPAELLARVRSGERILALKTAA